MEKHTKANNHTRVKAYKEAIDALKGVEDLSNHFEYSEHFYDVGKEMV